MSLVQSFKKSVGFETICSYLLIKTSAEKVMLCAPTENEWMFAMQGQIKLKQAALETSTNSFVQKEKDLQNKIEELEKRLEEICLNSARLAEAQKVSIFVDWVM